MVCYKDATTDPVQGPTTTVNWRSAPVNRPEQSLLGIQFTSQVNWGNNVPYVVLNSTNWVYANTGFHDGDSVPGIVGYEMDKFQATYPSPTSTGTTFTLLSQSPYVVGAGSQTLPLISTPGPPDYANSAVYQAPSTAWVFASGTMSWSWGLDTFTGPYADPRIQQATANILNQFQGGAPLAPAITARTTAAPSGATPSMTSALTTSRTAYGLGIFP